MVAAPLLTKEKGMHASPARPGIANRGQPLLCGSVIRSISYYHAGFHAVVYLTLSLQRVQDTAVKRFAEVADESLHSLK